MQSIVVVFIIIAQLHSKEFELRFCAVSNPARGVSEICDGENFWQWFRLEIRRKRLWSINHSSKTIQFIIKSLSSFSLRPSSRGIASYPYILRKLPLSEFSLGPALYWANALNYIWINASNNISIKCIY